jgi:hypothetical protein
MTKEEDSCDEESANLYRGDPLWTSKHSPESDAWTNENQDITEYDPWHDFAFVKCFTSSTSSHENHHTFIPARIIFFLEIPMGCEGEDGDMIVYPHGSYALVQSCVEDLNTNPPSSQTAIDYYKDRYGTSSSFENYFAHPSCSLLFWTMMEWTFFKDGNASDNFIKVPKLYITSTDNLCGSCIAVPYNLDQKPSIEWIIIRNREEWEECFDDDMNVRLGI